MGFWIFMLLSVLLVPVTMLLFGRSFLKKGPDVINPVFGYRSEMSMKNRDTWDFAHNCCGKIWKYSGIVLLPVSVLAMLFVLGKDVTTVGNVSMILTAVQLVPLIGSIFVTERALKRTFDINGLRKS